MSATHVPGSSSNSVPGEPPIKIWRAGTLTYTLAGLIVLFFWLLWGDFAFQLKERAIVPTFQLMLKKFRASDTIAGFLLGSLPQMVAIFLIPIISYRSDRHRGRWGRRIPYLLVLTPAAFLGMAGLAYGPVMGGALHRALGMSPDSQFPMIILLLGVFWAVFEFCTFACNALFMGLITDVVPRELYGRFFGLFRIFSLLAGMLFNFVIFKHAKDYYVEILMGLGLIYLLGFGAMCFRVKEGQYPLPDEMEAATGAAAKPRGFINAVRTYMRDCFSNSYYLWFFGSWTLTQMGFQAINLFSLFYAKSLNMSNEDYGTYAGIQLTISLFQAYPVGWLADKFHPIRVTLVAVALYAVATMIAFFTIDSPTALGWAIVLCGTIAGIWGNATAPLQSALLPKLKFGTFASALGMCVSLGLIVASFTIGRALDLLDHNYRYIYLWASVFNGLALLATIVVYRKFMALGGPKNYVAPE